MGNAGAESVAGSYQHPITFQSTSNPDHDFRYALENYTANLSRYLPEDREAPILDIGCGWGQFLWWLRKSGYQNARGLDRGTKQAEFCREIGLEAERVEDTVDFLRRHEEHFELVSMHHVIEHVEAEAGVELVAAIRESLRPGGRVILQTPNMSSIGAAHCRYIEVTHVTGFTESSLVELLQLAGFEDVSAFGSRTAFSLRPSRLAWLGLQAASRFVWRLMLVAELGADAPRILEKNLYATALRL